MRPTDEWSRRDALRVEFFRETTRKIDAAADNVRKLMLNGYRLRHGTAVGNDPIVTFTYRIEDARLNVASSIELDLCLLKDGTIAGFVPSWHPALAESLFDPVPMMEFDALAAERTFSAYLRHVAKRKFARSSRPRRTKHRGTDRARRSSHRLNSPFLMVVHVHEERQPDRERGLRNAGWVLDAVQAAGTSPGCESAAKSTGRVSNRGLSAPNPRLRPSQVATALSVLRAVAGARVRHLTSPQRRNAAEEGEQ